jgi:hypothetical protein
MACLPGLLQLILVRGQWRFHHLPAFLAASVVQATVSVVMPALPLHDISVIFLTLGRGYPDIQFADPGRRRHRIGPGLNNSSSGCSS